MAMPVHVGVVPHAFVTLGKQHYTHVHIWKASKLKHCMGQRSGSSARSGRRAPAGDAPGRCW
eukprot:SAG31_NODE_32_length_32319_cov_28.042681_10_plen_62_part_00